MSNLLESQQTFSILIARLIDAAYREGYKITVGEAYRPPEMAVIYANEGKGIINSLHSQRLAIDLNLFKDKIFLNDLAAYQKIGEYWESLSTPDFQCCWGGRFKKPDADHFSISYNGTK